MKRIVSLVLGVGLLLSLLGGIAYAEEKTYAEPITLTWAQAGVNEGVDLTGDAYGQYWLNKFNVTLDVIPMTFDAWEERLRIWINSGDMPDVANFSAYQYGELVDYVDQELIYRLPDGWQDRWTNVSAAQSYVPAASAIADNLDGTYLLLRPVFSIHKPAEKLSYHTLLYMRKDWMEAVGAELKDTYTIDEITEIARLIKENDPGALGGNLLPMCIETTNMGNVLPKNIFTHSVNNPYYRGEEGRYTWGPADPLTLEGLKIYQMWYKEGLLDPEFYTLEKSFGDQYRFYYEGNVGIITADGMAGRMKLFYTELENIELDPEASLHIAQLVGNDGKYHQNEQSNYWASIIFSPTISDAKFERAMDMIDFSASLEGQELINMGFKDADWTVDESGDYVNLLPDQGFTGLDKKYPSTQSLWGGMLCLGDDFAFVSPSNPKEFRDLVAKFYALRDELGQDPATFLDIDWDIAFYSSPVMSQATMTLADEYAQLVLMDGDLEANWNNWVNEKMRVVQPVLDELNEKFPPK
ncbi:MAG: ABC transporter substrate-binding protein [Oscillospiraceae bacterium]|jgi:putative aldouronate transport system substrate-binding protein|nr:ABC transporter substrate-binding protein [Oscillospiraceae bacterium]